MDDSQEDEITDPLLKEIAGLQEEIPSRRSLSSPDETDTHVQFLKELNRAGFELSADQALILSKHDEDYVIPEGKIHHASKKARAFDIGGSHHEKYKKGTKAYDLKKEGNRYVHSGREIESKEWKPESIIYHKEDFVRFIITMNEDGFQNKAYYKPLEIYTQQAHNWLAEDTRIDDYDDPEDRYEFAIREKKRCEQNSLYWLDKYLMLKEADLEDENNVKYIAKPVHEVIAFLFDCKYNLCIGKSRQIAATTTYLALALKKMKLTKNFFCKYITMDVDTAEEIIDDKLKFPVSELPNWFRPSVISDAAKTLIFARKIPRQKGVKGGANSKFLVSAPTVSAINGGSPSLVYIDEAGYIKVLGKMIREGRPTMFRENPKTGKLEMVRQIIVWSTGGVDEGKNKVKTKAFEEFMTDVVLQFSRDAVTHVGADIIPVFFDWTTRPGISQEFYESEKRRYTVEGPHAEQVMNQFRLTYPSKIEDMFLDSSKTLVPLEWIQKQEDRIKNTPEQLRPTGGYFEPVYDLNSPVEASDHPFKIKGAKFIPCELGDERISTHIFVHPEPGWTDRYYSGTDPVSTDNGYSNMAKAIIDDHLNTFAAIVNYRNPDHKETFSQVFLCGMYYGIEGAIPELLESNVGLAYQDYVDNKGLFHSLVYKTQLPPVYRGGGHVVGIDNKGNRNRLIINDMFSMMIEYGHRTYFNTMFLQLRTFVCTVTDQGRETWGTKDVKKYFDDVLFACVFAYICKRCFPERTPRKFASESDKYVQLYEIVEGADGNLTRVPVKRKIA